MTDRGGRGEEVADRLGRRFETDNADPSDRDENGEGGENGERSENDERNGNDKRSEHSDPSERSDSSDTSERVQNVKKEWNGSYIYLPDELDGPLDNEYDRLVYECGKELGWKPKKNRHYYPVVIAVGIDAVTSMDAETFRNHVEEFDLS